MTKILVLGGGRMGFGAAFDLARNSEIEEITVADIDVARAQQVCDGIGGGRLQARQIDVNDLGAVEDLMRGHDAVISCVVYRHNVDLARTAIRAGAHFCDLGGNNDVVAAELALDEDARAAGLNVIPDCGLAPGMVSVLAMHGLQRFPEADSLHIRVGGLPKDPQPPLDYQIVFSVEGLINEYVEAAKVVREGNLVTVESMTELEELDFPDPYGRMEAFQTSGGTSTLPQTLGARIRNLDYKTIRYPGHCEKFKTMLDLNLGSSDPVEIDGMSIAPRRLFGKLLVDNLPADGPDVVLVRLSFLGGDEGRRRELRYEIIDEYDEENGVSAMMRTTAFPASIIAQMMARGQTLEKGAIPQERAIDPEPFVRELERRNIRIREEMIT